MKYNTDNYFQLKKAHINKKLLEIDTYKMMADPKSFCLNSQKYTTANEFTEEEQLSILNIFEKEKYNFEKLNNRLVSTFKHIEPSRVLNFLREIGFLKEYEYKCKRKVYILEDSYLAVLQYLLIEVSPKLVGEIAFHINEGNNFDVAVEKSKKSVKQHLVLIEEKIEALHKNIYHKQTKVLDMKIRAFKEMDKKVILANEDIRKDIDEQNNYIRSHLKDFENAVNEKENPNKIISRNNKSSIKVSNQTIKRSKN